MTPRQQIRQIDQSIDANRAVLWTRHGSHPTTTEGCQAAWDAHPDLHAKERSLFRMRGAVQQVRDAADHAEHLKAVRAERRRYVRPRIMRAADLGLRSIA